MNYRIENVKQSVSFRASFSELFLSPETESFDISLKINEFSNRGLSFVEEEYFESGFSVIPLLSECIVLDDESGRFTPLPYAIKSVESYAELFDEYFSFDERRSVILAVIVAAVLDPYIQHIRCSVSEIECFPYAG